jgi:AsmA protein
MVQNVKSAFGAARKGDQVPRTDFSELSVPFTITHGVVDTRNTSMRGPLLRVTAAGKANLVDETLNFKVRPKFVATTKGQGDTASRMGLTVPVIVSGTFASPKFRPDLSGVLKAVPDTQKLKESILGPAQEQEAEEPESVTDKVKGLFKSLPFGR